MPQQSLGSLELTILLSVARLGEDAHGLAVRRDVSERTRHNYSVGAVYTTLQRLEEKKLLTSTTRDPQPVRGGRARRHFRVSAAGSRALRSAERVANSVWSGIPRTVGKGFA